MAACYDSSQHPYWGRIVTYDCSGWQDCSMPATSNAYIVQLKAAVKVCKRLEKEIGSKRLVLVKPMLQQCLGPLKTKRTTLGELPVTHSNLVPSVYQKRFKRHNRT
jgi:hypothetical protein